MLRKASILLVGLLCAACGDGGSSTPSSQQLAQAVVSSNGDLTKYVGGWSSCTAQSNGQYIRNNIKFDLSGSDLLFTPSYGTVGTFSDAACTQPIETRQITSVVPVRISAVSVVDIPQQPGNPFSGKADELPDIGQPAFRFAAFNAEGTSVWFSASNTFSGDVVRYNK